MTGRQGIITLIIVVAVVVIAAWSKLRFHDKEVYDEPQRVRIDEHPAFQVRAPAANQITAPQTERN